MPTAEDIAAQHELLVAHRQTLRHYLKQQAQLGEAYAPPGVTNGIREARAQVRRIKHILREWGETVEDVPEDEVHAPVEATHENTEASGQTDLQPRIDKRSLREMLVQRFSLEELETLCAEVEADLEADGVSVPVNLELVGGTGKTAKALHLIGYLERRGYLDYLIAAARRARS